MGSPLLNQPFPGIPGKGYRQRLTCDLDYESDLLVRAARKMKEQREIEARIDALASPEAVAEREAADKKVADAWKAFLATEKAAGMSGTGRSSRWATYVKANPDLDLGVETPSWNDEDTWKFVRAHARDQKGTSLPARIAASSFAGTEVGITAYIRSDRVADVMRAHQKAVTPEQFTRGHGEGLGYQAVAVSPKRYAHEGKVYREVILTRRDRGRSAEARAEMDRHRHHLHLGGPGGETASAHLR